MDKMIPSNDTFFINPYNFVRTPDRIERRVRTDDENVLTGFLNCTVHIRGKLALPDQSNAKPGPAKESKLCDFYRINNNPVIPGSELRGCIRSVFEAATGSCFSVINDDFLSARVPRPTTDRLPCIVEYDDAKDAWALTEAEKLHDNDVDPNAVHREWITALNMRRKKGATQKMRYQRRFADYDYVLTEEEIKSFKNVLNVYKENNPSYAYVFDEYLQRIEHKIPFVAFFQLDDSNLVYFSPAHTGRYSFQNTVSSLLGDFAPCDGKNGCLCPACRLFGTLKGDRPTASKLRFGDAIGENVKISEDYVNLPELSTPKITSAEFYAIKPGNPLTNVDRYNYDTPGVALRGRKFYYHSEPQSTKTLGDRSVATEVAESGSFPFKLFFNKISQTELDQLIWVLTLGENDPDSRYQHKLGFGKPMGYGSVKITVDSMTTRTYTKEAGYRLDETTDITAKNCTQLFGEDNPAIKDLLAITDVDYLGRLGRSIHYPLADDGTNGINATAAHQWFGANRASNGTFLYILPPLTDDPNDQLLPKMIVNKAPTHQKTGRENWKQSVGKTNARVTGIRNDNKKIFIELDTHEKGTVFFTNICRERIEPADVDRYVKKDDRVMVWPFTNNRGQLEYTMIPPRRK